MAERADNRREDTYEFRPSWAEVKRIPKGMYSKNNWPVVYLGDPEEAWFVTHVVPTDPNVTGTYNLQIRRPSGEGWGMTKTVSSGHLFAEGRVPDIREFAPNIQLSKPKKPIDQPSTIRQWIRRRIGL